MLLTFVVLPSGTTRSSVHPPAGCPPQHTRSARAYATRRRARPNTRPVPLAPTEAIFYHNKPRRNRVPALRHARAHCTMALPHPAQTAMTNVAAVDAADDDDAAAILHCRHAKSADKREGHRYRARPAAVQQAAAGGPAAAAEVALTSANSRGELQQQQQQQQSVRSPQPVFNRQVQQQLLLQLLASSESAAAATVVLVAVLLPDEGAEGQRCPPGATTNCGCCTVSDWSVWQVTSMNGGEYSLCVYV